MVADARLPDVVDIAIIGAGPAGLAAANRCMAGGATVVVLEGSKPLKHRDHNVPSDVAGGVGGAGLYSDGKLSFYPSAHSLWALPSEKTLREAYGWLRNLTSDLVPPLPPFPRHADFDGWSTKTSGDHFAQKRYPSLMLTPPDSERLVERLSAPLESRLFAQHHVERISLALGVFNLAVIRPDGTEVIVQADRVILCGGRFGPLLANRLSPQLDMVFRRFEYGIRIEQANEEFFLRSDASVDSKIRYVDPAGDVEWRTFCCCRGGRVLASKFASLYTYSGSAWSDSCASNIGFNCRLTSLRRFDSVSAEIGRVMQGNTAPFKMPFPEFRRELIAGRVYGPGLDTLLERGITQILRDFDLNGAVIHGPCIEGTGFYPKVSSQLETSVPRLYVAGDSTGLFRGLVAALISGFYAGAHAAEMPLEHPDDVQGTVQINKSPVNAMPLIFTAQSKQFFYCRDAICEYVLQGERLPINPFRVFDYFLSDRVDRNVVRRGNNQLIRACDELWVFGPIADGVLFELVYAGQLNKPIRFFTVATRATEIRPVSSLNEIRFEPEVHAPQQKREALMHELRRLVEVGIVRDTQPTLFDLR